MVVHGLVLDRIQQIKRGVVTFGSRCAPVSYGIICDRIYDPGTHVGEPVRRDPRDDQIYAVDQVDWLVTQVNKLPSQRQARSLTAAQGSPIPHTGITKAFQIKADPGRENEPWKVPIVMSSLPSDRLPRNMRQGGVQLVCSLDVSTDHVDKKLKNRHWYNVKPTFWRTTFDVKVVVGPSDLSFQLWSRDRRIRSSGHDPIAVKWMPARELDEEKTLALSV